MATLKSLKSQRPSISPSSKNTGYASCKWFIAELAERSPIIIKNSSSPSSRKKLDVRPYDRSTLRPNDPTTLRPYDPTTLRPYKVLLLTCVFNCTAGTPTPRLCSMLFVNPVVSAWGSESDDPGSSPGRGKALRP